MIYYYYCEIQEYYVISSDPINREYLKLITREEYENSHSYYG